MSIPFSNTVAKNGIIQQIERKLGFDDGYISGNATRLAQFTADVNLALDKVLALIFQTGGTWQFDDSNQTDYPIISTDLVSGQRDYSFVTDETGNLILEVYKVMVADPNGVFHEVYPVDVESGRAPENYDSGLNIQGIPTTYDKMANGIFLDAPANYNYTLGLKVYVSREGSYFATSDTTKKPGFAGLFHSYLALHPAYAYASTKIPKIAAALKNDLKEMESDIQEYYRSREKDTQRKLQVVRRSSR